MPKSYTVDFKDVSTVGLESSPVADDRDVEQRFEDAELRREEPVHRGGRHVGLLADGLHGGGAIAAIDEQRASGVDHRPPRQPCPRLVAFHLLILELPK